MQPNEQTINNIIEQNRHYGKANSNKKIKIAILSNPSLNQLIYIDALSRVLSHGNNELTIDYYLDNENILETKRHLEKLRINFNEYLTSKDLEHDIEDILNILKFTNNCSINAEGLFFDNNKLVDEDGNYTNYLKIANYYKMLSNTYDNILILDNNETSYDKILNILKLHNITKLEIPPTNNININDNIDKLRIESITPNLTLNTIEDIYLKLNKLLNNYKKYISGISINTYTDHENSIIAFLNDFNKMIIKVNNNLNLNSLIKYLTNLTIIIDYYLNELNDKTITDKELKLLKSLKIVLNNSLDLIGVIPIYL